MRAPNFYSQGREATTPTVRQPDKEVFVPATSSGEVKDFTIAIDDDALKDMNERLRRTRFPQDFGNDDWRYGYNTAPGKGQR